MSATVVAVTTRFRETPGTDPPLSATRRLAERVPLHEIKHGTWSKCDRRYSTTEILDGRAVTVWHNCNTWSCYYCGPLKSAQLGQSIAEEFAVDVPGLRGNEKTWDRGVFELWPSTTSDKDAIMSKARRENHRAISMPRHNGGFIIWTTLPTPDGDAVGPVEWRDLAHQIAKMIDQYLAVYTMKAGTRHLMRRNKHLAAARAYLDALEAETAEAGEEPKSKPEPGSTPAERDRPGAVVDRPDPAEEKAERVVLYTDEQLHELLDTYPDLVDAQTANKRVTQWHLPDVKRDGTECYLRVMAYINSRMQVEDRNVLKAHDAVRAGVTHQLKKDRAFRTERRDRRARIAATEAYQRAYRREVSA